VRELPGKNSLQKRKMWVPSYLSSILNASRPECSHNSPAGGTAADGVHQVHREGEVVHIAWPVWRSGAHENGRDNFLVTVGDP
jgi:hypothetical protein